MRFEVYRGEYGPSELLLASRLGSLSFGSEQAAKTYALTPNNALDNPIAPRILRALINIKYPILNTPDDPFMDMRVLIKALGLVQTMQIAIKHSQWIVNTNHWSDNYANEYGDNVDILLAVKPEALSDLYCLAYPLLDDPQVVKCLAFQGFDGAIHAGSGETAGEAEYKVFRPSQVRILEMQMLDNPAHMPRARIVA